MLLIIKHKYSLLSALIIIIACLVFFSHGIFFDKKTIDADTLSFFSPILWYTGNLWKAGIPPLWNPFLFNGYPNFADPQAQVFYPINIIISFLTTFSVKVVYLQLVLHYILAGLFMYLLSGHYMKKSASRLIASLIYMFNGYMINHFTHLSMINAVVWLPLIIYFLEKGWSSKKISYFIPTGVSIALLIFAGHPQTFLYIAYIVFFFSLFRCFYIDNEKRFSFFPIKLMLASFVFGFFLGAVQILPTYEFAQFSNRDAALEYNILTSSGQLKPVHLITLLSPDFFGGVRSPYIGHTDPTHSSIYCGIIFLALLPYSFIKAKKQVYFFGFMAVLSLLISMGDYGYIFKVLYKIFPGFDMFRSPVHFRFGFAFFAAIIAGIGLENILEKKLLKTYIKYGYLIAFYLIAFFLLIMTFTANVNSTIHKNIHTDILIFCVLFLAINLTFIVFEKKVILGRTLIISLLLMAFFDFYTNGAHAMTMGLSRAHNELDKTPLLVAALKDSNYKDMIKDRPFLFTDQESLYRIYVDDNKKSHTDFSPWLPYFPYELTKLSVLEDNNIIKHNLFIVEGISPMILKRFGLFNGTLIDNDFHKFLQLSNIKYIIRQDGTVSVLPKEKIFPRSYIVSKVEYMNNEEDILAELSNSNFNIKENAIVEKPLALGTKDYCSNKKEAKIVSYSPNKIILEAETSCDGLLVLSDTYYPGWMVSIDSGPKTAAIRTNYYFMGTIIPSGKHNIIFEFTPLSFKLGLIISIASFVLGIIYLIRKKEVVNRHK